MLTVNIFKKILTQTAVSLIDVCEYGPEWSDLLHVFPQLQLQHEKTLEIDTQEKP